ncbi:TPA: MSHA fimbrial major subunit MshB, partial [Aeromonas hydrophila subsp. hydrophila]|nr:MSHA fimbrial major subunit MshB [Aeromonas hydrophila subsp. hydrophila]
MTTTRLVPRYSGVASPQRAAGFSLIELVIVIVILGILAVTALPRFLDVTDEAKKASVEGVSGGFATGVSLVRAQWEAEGRAKQDSLNTVLYDGSRFYLTTPTDTQVSNGELSPGYPMDTSAGGGIDVDPANLT